MRATLTNHPVGSPFIEITSTDSTNNYAMEQVHLGLTQHGTVYFSHEQTAGKGQRGKSWYTQKDKNIIMSVVFNTSDLKISKQFGLNMAVALAAYDLFLKYAPADTYIKWPNDLYWCDRKAGGILIENVVRGQEWQWAIVGIGININQTVFNTAVTNAVSLKQITGKNYDPTACAKELCLHLEQRHCQLLNDEIKSLLVEYNAVLYKGGKQIRLKKNNMLFDCILKEVNIYGQLIVEGALQQTFNNGEVEWIIN